MAREVRRDWRKHEHPFRRAALSTVYGVIALVLCVLLFSTCQTHPREWILSRDPWINAFFFWFFIGPPLIYDALAPRDD